MNEKEKDIGKQLSETVSKLDRENQKYILGMAVGMAMAKEPKREVVENAVCV